MGCECSCRARCERRGQRNTQDEKSVDEKAVDEKAVHEQTVEEKAVHEKAGVFVSPENTHWHERRRCARLEGDSSIELSRLARSVWAELASPSFPSTSLFPFKA